MPNKVSVGCVYDESDTPRVRRDASSDFVQGQVQAVVDGNLAYAGLTMAGTGTTSDADPVCLLRKFLEDAGFLSSTEDVMSLIEMRAYVNGRCVL